MMAEERGITKREAGLPAFTQDEIKLIKTQIAPKCNDDELKLFLYQCERTKLDPFSRQIYAIKRKSKLEPEGKMTIQTSIDGYRVIADRTGQYAGNDDPVYEVDQKTGKPIKATVTVWKMVNGQRCAFTATARWDEYYPGKETGFMWDNKPFLMLGKCGEALALRKAFPADLSGVYTEEEMMQADREVITPSKKPNMAVNGFKLFLSRMAKAKETVGEDIYYEIVKGEGFEHANQIKKREDQERVLTLLRDMAREVKKQAAEKKDEVLSGEEDEPVLDLPA